MYCWNVPVPSYHALYYLSVPVFYGAGIIIRGKFQLRAAFGYDQLIVWDLLRPRVKLQLEALRQQRLQHQLSLLSLLTGLSF